MKCEYFKFYNNGDVYSVIIENDKVYLKGDKIEQVNVDSRKCFNTLISLFSLKNSWNTVEESNPVYYIEFENGNKNESYSFGINNVPENFNLFIMYISKLVGDSI